MTEYNPWFDSGPAEPDSPWRIRPHERNRWLLSREAEPIAVLGVLGTGEWWICPAGESLPWPETYWTREAAARAVMLWWRYRRAREG
ncbi:hypothetical protein [Cryptosporangium sp. NPDC051539]|uniref:hypothetical protein n=1 Tax=Cryptosporangium sp. NPDC051539 TaxID=3363962 RepID=UPI00379710D1